MFGYLSYVVYSQIWLNLPMDDCYFGYTTELTKITLACLGTFDNISLFQLPFLSFFLAVFFLIARFSQLVICF
jgi:hypothetical protein